MSERWTRGLLERRRRLWRRLARRRSRRGAAREDDDIEPYFHARNAFATGFRLDDDDETTRLWYPQGLTGTFDIEDDGVVDGEQLVILSAYDTYRAPPGLAPGFDPAAERGIRVTVVRLTDPAEVTYRHVLLVEPIEGDDGMASFKVITKPTPNPDSNEERPHAGGCVWVGKYFFVTDENRLLVFDTTRMKDLGYGHNENRSTDLLVGYVSGRYHALGFRYILPLVYVYEVDAATQPRLLRHFHTLGFDRTAYPRRLVSAKFVTSWFWAQVASGFGATYDSDASTAIACFWDIREATGLLAETAGQILASDIALLDELHVQGITALGDTLGLCLSGFANSFIELVDNKLAFRDIGGGAGRDFSDWPRNGEGLARALDSGYLWNLTELPEHRVTFAVREHGDPRPIEVAILDLATSFRGDHSPELETDLRELFAIEPDFRMVCNPPLPQEGGPGWPDYLQAMEFLDTRSELLGDEEVLEVMRHIRPRLGSSWGDL